MTRTRVCRAVGATLAVLWVSATACVAATDASAWDAIQQAAPDLGIGQARQLVGRLTALTDGQELVLEVAGQPRRFRCIGDQVQYAGVAADTATNTAPAAPEAFRSAVVGSLSRPIDLGPLFAALRRNDRWPVARGEAAVAWTNAASGDLILVTADGTICVRSHRPLSSLKQVDRLLAEQQEALRGIRLTNGSITAEEDARVWASQHWYSSPAGVYKWLLVLGGGEMAVTVPDLKVGEARLTLWMTARIGMSMDGRELVSVLDARRRHPWRLDSSISWVECDLGDQFQYGTHLFKYLYPPLGWNGKVAQRLDLFAPQGEPVDFQAAIQTLPKQFSATSLSSLPLAEIGQQWPALADLLAGQPTAADLGRPADRPSAWRSVVAVDLGGQPALGPFRAHLARSGWGILNQTSEAVSFRLPDSQDVGALTATGFVVACSTEPLDFAVHDRLSDAVHRCLTEAQKIDGRLTDEQVNAVMYQRETFCNPPGRYHWLHLESGPETTRSQETPFRAEVYVPETKWQALRIRHSGWAMSVISIPQVELDGVALAKRENAVWQAGGTWLGDWHSVVDVTQRMAPGLHVLTNPGFTYITFRRSQLRLDGLSAEPGPALQAVCRGWAYTGYSAEPLAVLVEHCPALRGVLGAD